jgi:hypothetical protein
MVVYEVVALETAGSFKHKAKYRFKLIALRPALAFQQLRVLLAT